MTKQIITLEELDRIQKILWTLKKDIATQAHHLNGGQQLLLYVDEAVDLVVSWASRIKLELLKRQSEDKS